MNPVTPIKAEGKEEAQESLIAFSFGDKGAFVYTSDCRSIGDEFALLSYAHQVAQRRLRELEEEITLKRFGQRFVA